MLKEVVLQVLMWTVILCDYVSYIPQLYKLVKIKRSESISVGSWILWTISSLCDVTYSIILGRYELIVASMSSLLLNSMVLILTLSYSKTNNKRLSTLSETDEQFEARLNKIRAQDGNHMLLITAMIEERNRAKSRQHLVRRSR